MPSVSSTTLSSDKLQISFIGTNFFTSGYTASVSYGGVVADSVSITSASSAVAVYNLGVPLQGTGAKPVLSFVSTSSSETHWASSTASNLINSLSITSSSSGLQCSFSGGCSLTIDALGLASTLTNSTRATVSVCG